MKNKREIAKIIFIVSFLPYIILLVISVYYAIFGHNVYAFLGVYIRTDYGIKAFLDTLVWNGIILCIFPVLPAIVIYQMIYIIIKIRNRIRKK